MKKNAGGLMMDMNADCPIFSAGGASVPCKKEKCAWYDQMQCVLFSLNMRLSDIANNTAYIYVQDTSSEIKMIHDLLIKKTESPEE